MNVGVIYSTNTGRVRWIHRPDVPGQEANVNLLPGEAVAVLPHADLPTVQAALSALIGKVPVGDRYVFVPVGPTALFNIAEVHVMDPLIDTVPSGKVAIASATAGPGWTYNSTTGLTPPAAVSNPK